MSMFSVTLTIHVAWWVKWYIASLKLFCLTFGTEPDVDKVVATVLRGVRVGPVKAGR